MNKRFLKFKSKTWYYLLNNFVFINRWSHSKLFCKTVTKCLDIFSKIQVKYNGQLTVCKTVYNFDFKKRSLLKTFSCEYHSILQNTVFKKDFGLLIIFIWKFISRINLLSIVIKKILSRYFFAAYKQG